MLALTESCWLFVLASALAAVAGSGLPSLWPLWFALIYVNIFSNLLPETEAGDRVLLAARLLAAATAIAVLGPLPPRPEFLALAVYLVWHCRTLAELDVPEARYRASVFAGVIGVLIALLLHAILAGSQASTQTVTVAAFAVTAVLSLMVAQRQQLVEEEDLAPSGGGAWVIAATAIGFVICGTALLVLLVPPVAQGGVAALAFLGNLLLLALFYLLLPIVSLFFNLLYGPLSALLRGLRLPPPRPPTQSNTAFEQLLRQQALLNSALDRWLHVGEWILVGLIVLAVLVLVSGGIRRHLDPVRRRSEQRSSVWRWSLLADWLAQWRARAGAVAIAAGTFLTRPGAAGQPHSVREAYLDVQRHASRLGYGRRPDQTALEHCGVLAERLPTVALALHRLAVGYGDEHYGGVAPAEALPPLLPDWRRIVDACIGDGQDGT